MDRMKKVLFLHYIYVRKGDDFLTFHEIKKNEEVNEILKESDMAMKDRMAIVSAISNHDESTGGALDPISAALIIADKTDVRQDRAYVKNKRRKENHIHKSSDRYQYLLHV